MDGETKFFRVRPDPDPHRGLVDSLEGLATVTRSQGMMGSRAEPGHWELLWEVGPPVIATLSGKQTHSEGQCR